MIAAQMKAAAEALARVLAMSEPADAALSRFFRAHANYGQRDRAFIAESVFGVLRRRYGLEYQTGADSAPRLLIAYLNRVRGVSLRELGAGAGRADIEWAAQLRREGRGEPPLHVLAELPQWVVARLETQMPREEILALGRALAEPAPLDLRVNALNATRDEVLAKFAAEGIEARPTPYSKLGVRLTDKIALNLHPLFTGGAVEVQDESSQLACYLVAAKRREMVVDFCAGAGGKTLALGALMQSAGRLYAFEVSESRLNRLKPRLKRSGLSNVYPQLLSDERDGKVKRLAGKIDRVLVDAPCSGMGTLRRNPDLKWRQSEASVAELTAKQRAILTAAATLVKSGGRLVYATCSLLKAENQDVVADFLGAHPEFRLKPAHAVLKEQGIALDTGDYLELYPHRHGCDGFFSAVMERC
jgi:16S rRNA (cytosine967-C5)-methyltransferase